MLDYDIAKSQLLQMKQMHSDVCRFLEDIDSDFHENAANTLASRIENLVIEPIDIALKIIDVIVLIGQEQIPSIVSMKWNLQILQVLNKGGIEIEF